MRIGEAARQSGISAKMIRYYEATGLLAPADRLDSGYRDYSPDDVQELQFIRRARDLGFSVAEISALVGLWQDRSRRSKDVKMLAQMHIAQLRAKAAELEKMADSLQALANACADDDEASCAILSELASGIAQNSS